MQDFEICLIVAWPWQFHSQANKAGMPNDGNKESMNHSGFHAPLHTADPVSGYKKLRAFLTLARTRSFKVSCVLDHA
jgi:hypothetical protein